MGGWILLALGMDCIFLARGGVNMGLRGHIRLVHVAGICKQYRQDGASAFIIVVETGN